MKVELPYIVQDQVTAAAKGMRELESFRYDASDETMLDGPVCERVAVLDFDEGTGALRPGVRFEPPSQRRTMGRYAVDKNRADRDFQNVSVFATVLKTIAAFEREDVLGRRVRWAFDGPQLLVVPRAGDWANAFYERESRSLQFFHFHSENYRRTIYTAQSHDIVAHETGHAILDGIHPDLYDAVSPEGLAIHEAVADLTSLVMSLSSGTLRKKVLDDMGGTIRGMTALSAVAEEFGSALNGSRPLRDLWNNKKLGSGSIRPTEPHDLSQVLSGALFRVLHEIHEQLKHDATERALQDDPSIDREGEEFQQSGKALWVATQILRRMMFRALDYLPPGEISFLDYGRAIWAADELANPQEAHYRDILAREFVRRGIARTPASLSGGLRPKRTWQPKIDVETLRDSDWAAYDFANRERQALGIPDGVAFHVLPRLHTHKTTRRGDHDERVWFHELLFKVSWEQEEANDLGFGTPHHRKVRAGLTLVLGEDGKPRALLHSDARPQQQKARTLFLKRLIDERLLDPRGGSATDPGGVETSLAGGTLRVTGAARSLHIAHREAQR